MTLRTRLTLVATATLLSSDGLAQRPAPPRSGDERMAVLQKTLKSDPKNMTALNELAGFYLQRLRESGDKSDFERASRLVATVLDADPTNYAARRYALQLQLQRHEFKAAIVAAQALLREKPSDVVVLGLEGDAQLEIGDYDAAERAYQKMVDLRPGMASFTRVAFFRFVTGDAPGAIELMKQAVDIAAGGRENTAWCLADLGQMLWKTGALNEAEQAFRRALEVFPAYHPAMAGMGHVQESREKLGDAAEWYRKAQAVVPLPEYAGALAKVYRRTGEGKLERQQLERLDLYDALGKASGEPANRNLALAFADLNYRPERALALAEAELDFRQDVYTYDGLAWALYRNGKPVEAAAAMRKALAMGTPEPSFRAHAAPILGDDQR